VRHFSLTTQMTQHEDRSVGSYHRFCGDTGNGQDGCTKSRSAGYNSLWTVERVLWPVDPKLPSPVTPDSSLPEAHKYNLDPPH